MRYHCLSSLLGSHLVFILHCPVQNHVSFVGFLSCSCVFFLCVLFLLILFAWFAYRVALKVSSSKCVSFTGYSFSLPVL